MQNELFELGVKMTAEFSENKVYRYFLSREWDSRGKKVAFVGLNPSTADEFKDDPTIRRCIDFSKKLGGGSLWMVNLFAYRSTDPSKIRLVEDPVGPENDYWISKVASSADFIIAAWGNNGDFLSRDKDVVSLVGCEVYALRITSKGMPSHPLYLPKNSEIIPYLER